MELKLNLLAKASREPGGKVYKQGCLNDTLCSTHHMLKVSDENLSKYSKYILNIIKENESKIATPTVHIVPYRHLKWTDG